MTSTIKTKKSDRSPLRELFVEQLKDILWAEKQLAGALSKNAKAAIDPDLAESFKGHQVETQRQIERIHDVFALTMTRIVIR